MTHQVKEKLQRDSKMHHLFSFSIDVNVEQHEKHAVKSFWSLTKVEKTVNQIYIGVFPECLKTLICTYMIANMWVFPYNVDDAFWYRFLCFHRHMFFMYK